MLRVDVLAKKEVERQQKERQQAMMSKFFTPTRTSTSTLSATPSGQSCSVAHDGYSAEELKGRTFRREVQKIQVEMIEVAGDDPLRQIQLADAVWKRFTGLKHKIVKTDEEQVATLLLKSLKEFFKTLRDTYRGRWPNEIRAVAQGVGAARDWRDLIWNGYVHPHRQLPAFFTSEARVAS